MADPAIPTAETTPVPTAAEMMARVVALAGHLPGVAVASHYGAPALKVTTRSGATTIANPCREPGALAVYCPLELKAALIAAAPDIYFDTPHFANWPAVLVRMAAVDDATLTARLEAAWMARVGKKAAEAWGMGQTGR